VSESLHHHVTAMTNPQPNHRKWYVVLNQERHSPMTKSVKMLKQAKSYLTMAMGSEQVG
jgi:hypothetical protein